MRLWLIKIILKLEELWNYFELMSITIVNEIYSV